MTAAHAALSRQLDGISFRHAALWGLAAMIAISAHAGAGLWLLRETPDEVMVAGAAEISIDMAMLGTAEADQVSSGEALEPVEATEIETVEPVLEVGPTTTPPVEQPVQPVENAQPTTAQAVPPVPVDAQPPIEAPEPSQVQVAAMQPVEPRLAPVEEAKPIEPIEEAESVPLPEIAPIPQPRPKPKIAQEKPKPKKPEQVVQKKPAKQRAGNGGRNDADARKGRADGNEKAVKSAAVRQGNGGERGNAAVSNYPGKVASKLRRALPRRSSGGGQVLVSFRVSASGGVSSIRVSRSSGSPAVDKAALDTVRRAAPFPPIPADAGRSTWDFALPLTFRR